MECSCTHTHRIYVGSLKCEMILLPRHLGGIYSPIQLRWQDCLAERARSKEPAKELKMQSVTFAHTPGSAADTTPPTEAPLTPAEKNQCGKNDADTLRDVPVKLMIEFLTALMDKDFQRAKRLCHMILIYEPHHPEASEFLPLIQRKLREEQQADQDSDESKSDDEDEDSGCDEELSLSSDCFSSLSNEDGSGEEKQAN
ncbi:glutamate-rich protein 2 isoform X2 [Vanacampus margaritifer]